VANPAILEVIKEGVILKPECVPDAGKIRIGARE